MYWFFPGNYKWSQAVLRLLFTGGSIGEVGRAMGDLQRCAEHDAESWYEAWSRVAETVRRRGEAHESSRHPVSARESYLGACAYYQCAIAFLDHMDQRRRSGHSRSVDLFSRFGELMVPRAERVEVPYGDRQLPAWFVPAVGPYRRRPAVFYLPGWDSTKEQGVGLALALRERGISVLLCDGPGIGEAVMFRGLPNRYDYEIPGGAFLDYLAGRGDVDEDRVCVVGASLGSYRAARVAAFDRRLAGAVLWGAIWDFLATWRSRASSPDVLPTPDSHAAYVMGMRDSGDIRAELSRWRLAGVAKQISCPVLVLHGENDSQIPLEHAHRLYDRMASTQKELKVFTADEGGDSHCMNDNRDLAHDYISNWLEDLLVARAQHEGTSPRA